MRIYYFTAYGVVPLSVIIFFSSLNITLMSCVPAILILVSVLQGIVFRQYSNGEIDDATAHSMHEIDREKYAIGMKYHANAKLAIIPILLLPILYFGSAWKVMVSIAVYLLSYFIPIIFIKLAHKETRYGKTL